MKFSNDEVKLILNLDNKFENLLRWLREAFCEMMCGFYNKDISEKKYFTDGSYIIET